MKDITENATPGDNGFFEKLLAQFGHAPLNVLYKYVASLGTDDNLEVFKALMEKAQLNGVVDQQIRAWQQEPIRASRTRFVIKLINHTDHTFAVSDHNLAFDTNELGALGPWDIQALRFDFAYSRKLGSPSKDMFKHFIIFGDRDIACLLDFGLRVNTSFGTLSPTLTPVRTNRVTSIGATPIPCSTRFLHAASEEPYNFTVEITLG
ncbi:hypothetical protein ACLEJQ_24490 [Pseudomonas sp. SMV71]|uniref:hypothetical protein n=1 Tax=Pseudomonas sp. SMV71 TaxID=3390195 RepID=UPI003F82B247